jgi:hypothetical protein
VTVTAVYFSQRALKFRLLLSAILLKEQTFKNSRTGAGVACCLYRRWLLVSQLTCWQPLRQVSPGCH